MPDIQRGTLPTQIPIRPATIQRPDAYNYATPPINRRGNVNGHRTGQNVLQGASAGSAFGPYGAAAGAVVGLASDLFQVRIARKNAEKANEEARKAAAAQADRAHAEARAARAWNSEQQQIRRMRMAGLSPGLAYGQMSPSTAVAAPQDKADIHKADTPKFDNESILRALELLVKQQQADTALAAQQSTSALQGSQIDLNQIDKLYRGAEYQANILATLADANKSDAEKLEIIKLLSSRQNNLDASTRNLNAAADVTEQTGVDLAKSQTASNNASAALSSQQQKTMRLQYNIDESQWNSIKKFCSEFSDGEDLAPLVMKICDSIAASSGTTIGHVIENLTDFRGIIGDALNLFGRGKRK